MIEKIKDSGKFICNVISVTGKILKQVEFNSFEEACKYKENMKPNKTIKEVEITTSNNTPLNCEDSAIKDADTVKVLYFNSNGDFDHEVEKNVEVAERELRENHKTCAHKKTDKPLYTGYIKYINLDNRDYPSEIGIYRWGYEVEDPDGYILDTGRNTSDFENFIIPKNNPITDTDDVKIEDDEVIEEKICCVCGEPIKEWSNNAEPICTGECCDNCNANFVIPARILKTSKPYQKTLFVKCSECGLPVILAKDTNVCSCGAKYDMQGNQIIDIKVADAKAYIGEYQDEFYEHYRGVNVYKKQLNNIEYEFVAQFLDKKLKGKTEEEIEEKIDKAIEAYVNSYAKDFEIKKVGE